MNSERFDVGERFLRRVRQSAANVLGDSPVGREVAALCDDHAEARELMLQDRSSGVTVVAVCGATGQGKSWLIRQLVRQSPVAARIRSGNQLDDATEKLTWIGPQPPADLDTRCESYLPCEVSHMQSIGVPYLIVDAPGSTDDRHAIAAVASRALSIASVIVMVIRRDQLRSQAVGTLTHASEGTLVVPVINAVRKRDNELDADIESLVSHLRRTAATSLFAAAVIVDDFEVHGGDEAATGAQAAQEVAARLQEQLIGGWDGDRRKSTRLAALDSRFRAALKSVLQEHLPGLTAAVERLNREAVSLPAQVAENLVGEGGPLRAVIRSRLRALLLLETSSLWFPYRSVLGVLNLTHGAWDRVALTLSGSLPSLIGAAWTSAQNFREGRSNELAVREGLQQRSSAAVADRLAPLAARFRDELSQLRSEHPGRRREVEHDSRGARDSLAYLAGIDTLQETSQKIFDEQIQRVAINRAGAGVMGLIGAAMFWVCLAGPIASLYGEYFAASAATLRGATGNLDSYPHPDASFMLTSVILSLLPMAIYAMLVLSWVQRRGRVEVAEQQIRAAHHDSIVSLQQTGVLTLRWDDPLLADAEFLLSAGAAELRA